MQKISQSKQTLFPSNKSLVAKLNVMSFTLNQIQIVYKNFNGKNQKKKFLWDRRRLFLIESTAYTEESWE